MNSVNSKNLSFLIVFIALLAIVCLYTVFTHDSGAIYTDLNELNLED